MSEALMGESNRRHPREKNAAQKSSAVNSPNGATLGFEAKLWQAATRAVVFDRYNIVSEDDLRDAVARIEAENFGHVLDTVCEKAPESKKRREVSARDASLSELRGLDLNQRPSGYES